MRQPTIEEYERLGEHLCVVDPILNDFARDHGYAVYGPLSGGRYPNRRISQVGSITRTIHIAQCQMIQAVTGIALSSQMFHTPSSAVCSLMTKQTEFAGYAINATPEHALRSNRDVLPARVIAALGVSNMNFRRPRSVASPALRTVLATMFFLCCVPAHGSVCLSQSPEVIASDAEVAFIGKVTSVEESEYDPTGLGCWKRSQEHPECGAKLLTLAVTESFRGALSGSVTVVSEDACYCSAPYWKKEHSYLVVARLNTSGHPGNLVASNVCGGTGEESTRAAAIDALRASGR